MPISLWAVGYYLPLRDTNCYHLSFSFIQKDDTNLYFSNLPRDYKERVLEKRKKKRERKKDLFCTISSYYITIQDATVNLTLREKSIEYKEIPKNP